MRKYFPKCKQVWIYQCLSRHLNSNPFLFFKNNNAVPYEDNDATMVNLLDLDDLENQSRLLTECYVDDFCNLAQVRILDEL